MERTIEGKGEMACCWGGSLLRTAKKLEERERRRTRLVGGLRKRVAQCGKRERRRRVGEKQISQKKKRKKS